MKNWWYILGCFFLAGFLVYGHTLGYDFVRWDDGLLIYENPAIRGITVQNLKTIFTTYDPELYIPLSLLSYQIDYMIGGASPAIYHFTNLILHCVNACLVAFLTKLLTKNTWICIVTGALFLLHPLHTEAVVWASARKDLLATCFFLISFVAFVLNRSRLSIAAFLFALLSKVTVLGLPIILFVYNWIHDGKITRKSIVSLLPYCALSIIFAAIAMLGKTAVLSATTPLQTFLMSAKSTVFYIEKLILPMNLSVLYPYNDAIELTSPAFLIPAFLLLLLAIGFIAAATKYNRDFWLYGAIFTVTLAPSLLNFAKGGTYYIASDRYAYIPSIGLLALLAMLLSKLPYKTIVAGVVICTAALGASMQSRVWANTETLFTNVLKAYPQSHVAHNNLGNTYRRTGDTASAISSYTTALSIELPTQDATSKAQILSNVGSALRAQGKTDEAMQMFLQAKSLDPDNPQVHLGIAIVYHHTGKFQAAEQAFLQVLSLQPDLALAHLNLGALYMAMARTEDAISRYNIAIELNPFFPQAYYNLGIALRSKERNREAKDAYQKAVELAPTFVSARINLGILYAERQDIDEAIAQFEYVLQIDPENRQALSALQQLQ